MDEELNEFVPDWDEAFAKLDRGELESLPIDNNIDDMDKDDPIVVLNRLNTSLAQIKDLLYEHGEYIKHPIYMFDYLIHVLDHSKDDIQSLLSQCDKTILEMEG